jgi:hypothetical protein
MNKATQILDLLHSTGLMVEEYEVEIDQEKFYVFDQDLGQIVSGPFDTQEEAQSSCSDLPASCVVAQGSDFEVEDEMDDSEMGDDEDGEMDDSEMGNDEDGMEEASPKKVVSFSGGKKHLKMACPGGMTFSGGKCVLKKKGYKVIDGKYIKMSSAEIAARKKAFKSGGARTAAAKARKITLKLRSRAGL